MGSLLQNASFRLFALVLRTEVPESILGTHSGTTEKATVELLCSSLRELYIHTPKC